MIICPGRKLSDLFEEFYGIRLQLVDGDKIKARAIRKVAAADLKEIFEWVDTYREHVINRLRMDCPRERSRGEEKCNRVG